MNETWQAIETLLSSRFPAILEDFNPPCTESDLAFLKDVTQGKLFDLYELYESHDGQSSYDLAFWSPWRLLSVKHIKTNIKVMNEDLVAEWAEDGMSPTDEAEANGPVKPILWSSYWVPIASNGGGDLLCIDLDPDVGGRVGQVIVWWHETVVREVLYSSFTDLMTDYLQDLQAGLYELVEGRGLVKL
ncbi:MAG: hypothetical protein HC933_11150 [Pleurocapsa sp. SU_196_0]|nr:hypothetical protein [Pleurocapsa sp. SU_196_0]